MDLDHGGQLQRASRNFERPAQDWVDLSTGISPWLWPVPAIPQEVWHRLPDDEDGLEAIAADYYATDPAAVLAAPGSQFALQAVPRCLPPTAVAVPQRGYGEHHLALQNAGHTLVTYANAKSLEALVAANKVGHVLVINPNNPTGESYCSTLLLSLLRQLRKRNGYLLVDEAFADCAPTQSLAEHCPTQGLVVYRSLGKFFGLAGVRLGFLLAEQSIVRSVQESMGPWLVSHSARWLGAKALADTAWQAQQRGRLFAAAERWTIALEAILPDLRFTGTGLFVTGSGDADYCEALYAALGRRAVLVRLFQPLNEQGMIRFGLPLTENIERALDAIAKSARECSCLLD